MSYAINIVCKKNIVNDIGIFTLQIEQKNAFFFEYCTSKIATKNPFVKSRKDVQSGWQNSLGTGWV